MEISGKNVQNISAVLCGTTQAVFDSVSAEGLIAILHVFYDPRIPDDVSYKAGYVNPTPPAANFGSARRRGDCDCGRAGAGPRIGAGGSGTAHGSGTAFLESIPPRAALPLGRLDGCTVRARVRISAGALVAGGHGLLAFSDYPARDWREQSRSWRQQLVFSLSGSPGGLVHRCWGAAVLARTT